MENNKKGRICYRCKIYKNFKEFHKSKKNNNGYCSHCKECQRKSDLKNIEKLRAYRKVYKLRTKERASILNKIWYKKNKERLAEYSMNRHYYKKYGIYTEDFIMLNDIQEGKCAVCLKKPYEKLHKKLFIDHDHKTGKIRMLLCNGCNNGSGIGDNIELMKAKIKYLEYFNE